MSAVKCTCADWVPGVAKINAYIDMGRIHSMGEYSGKPFMYCPWCGKLLTEEVKPVVKSKVTIVCDFCHKEVERKSVSSQFRNSGFHGKTRFAGYACPVCVEKQAAFWKRRSRKACK